MKFLVIGDPHISDKAPSTRKDDYTEAIFKKLEFAIELANSKEVSCIIIPGDIFHRKIPTHNSHALIRRTLSLFRNSKSPIFVVAGNHDYYGSLDNLDRQPISVLVEAGACRLLSSDTNFLVSEGNVTASISGSSYKPQLDCGSDENINQLYELNHSPGADIKIGVFHQMILPDGMTFFDEYVNFSDLYYINSDLIVCGHYHGGYSPALVKSYNKYFLNPGSISRGSADSLNLNKDPFVTLVHINKVENSLELDHETFFVPHEDSSLVFDIKGIERKKENLALKEFISNLTEFEAESLDSETPSGILRILKSMGADEHLVQLADKYLNYVSERVS